MGAATQPLMNIEQEALRVLEGAAGQGIPLRVVGGLAVRLHTQSGMPPGIARHYKDLDLVTTKNAGREVERYLGMIGYEPNRQFNTLNGGRRLLFYDVPHERQIDVFVGTFKMCHAVPIADRLDVDPLTIPLAELLLTKLQVVHLNEKDQRDILALLVCHEIGNSDDDVINSAHIGQLLSGDWGLWRTTKLNLDRTRKAIPTYELSAAEQGRIEDRVEQLWAVIEETPKSAKWKLRDRIGDRKRWYELPEEVG
jgi:hypothetical protein